MTVRVVTASQASSRDLAAIEAGTPPLVLMQRAGAVAASAISSRYAAELRRGALVLCGPGNNGGDGWVVARDLTARGVRTRVVEIAPPRTDDAAAMRAAARHVLERDSSLDDPGVVVDALLGTGATGPLRGAIADGARRIAALRAAGARVVSLDLPTGLDATTGSVADDGVCADLTLSFGTLKRGHLLARDRCGEVLVLDIGLGEHAAREDGAGTLVDAAWVAARVPAFAASAHKGDRKKLLVVGGARGMAGAAVLAIRAAFRSGIGMVRACVEASSIDAVQAGAMEATAQPWPDGAPPPESAAWSDALLIGPGLGAERRDAVEGWLRASGGRPVVLDADALNAFAGDLSGLAGALGNRRAILTPHMAEMARLAGCTVDEVLANRWEIGGEVAARVGAAVLLKGVPTVVASPGAPGVLVSATGSPVLATGGSGDVLSGVAATLLAQMDDPGEAAACAAWVHGRAAERAGAGRTLRGVVLGDVVEALRDVWAPPVAEPSDEELGVLVRLPRIGDDA